MSIVKTDAANEIQATISDLHQPCEIFMWFKPLSMATTQWAVAVGANHTNQVFGMEVVSTPGLRGRSRQSAPSTTLQQQTNVRGAGFDLDADDVWYLGRVHIYDGVTGFLDAQFTQKGFSENAEDSVAITRDDTPYTRVNVGDRNNTFDLIGSYAELAIFDSKQADSVYDACLAGAAIDTVSSPLHYWPLLDDLLEKNGGPTLTNTGGTIATFDTADHPITPALLKRRRLAAGRT